MIYLSLNIQIININTLYWFVIMSNITPFSSHKWFQTHFNILVSFAPSAALLLRISYRGFDLSDEAVWGFSFREEDPLSPSLALSLTLQLLLALRLCHTLVHYNLNNKFIIKWTPFSQSQSQLHVILVKVK